MFEVLTEDKGMAVLLFLIIGGSFAYLFRFHKRKRENYLQGIKNDFLTVFLFQALFALFIFSNLSQYSTPKSDPLPQIKSLEDVQKEFKDQYEDISKTRTDLSYSVGIIGVFIVFSSFGIPFIIFNILREIDLKKLRKEIETNE